MQSILKGKRLLVLGGTMWRDAIKTVADKYGIFLIVCGNNRNSLLIDISDEYYEIDNLDEDAMSKFIAEKNIDGVYLGGNENVISHAINYVIKANLPCMYRQEIWSRFNDKSKFKNMCEKNKLPIVKTYTENDTNIKYPVVVKPIDSAGSIGLSVCRDENDLKAAIECASSMSLSGEYIIEEYVDNASFITFYTIRDKNIKFTGLAKKYSIALAENSFLGKLWIWNSKSDKEYFEQYNGKVEKMLEEAGVSEGSIWMEIFSGRDGVFFNEAGYRYGGEMTMYPIYYYYGINQVERDMLYALGCLENSEITPLVDMKLREKHEYYCIYAVYLKPGTIARITGLDWLIENEIVIRTFMEKKEGDLCEDVADIRIRGGYIHFTAKNKEEIPNIIKVIEEKLHIIDTDDNDMIRHDAILI